MSFSRDITEQRAAGATSARLAGIVANTDDAHDELVAGGVAEGAADPLGAGARSLHPARPADRFADGEFVQNCRASDIDRLVIQAVVAIARGLRKSTIAERVGGDETIALLTGLGVDYGQGYRLGVPAPLADQLAPV